MKSDSPVAHYARHSKKTQPADSGLARNARCNCDRSFILHHKAFFFSSSSLTPLPPSRGLTLEPPVASANMLLDPRVELKLKKIAMVKLQ